MRFIGESALEASCISGCGGKAPGPGVLDIAATASKVDDQYSVWNSLI